MQSLILEIYDDLRDFYPFGLHRQRGLYAQSKYHLNFLKRIELKFESLEYSGWKKLLKSIEPLDVKAIDVTGKISYNFVCNLIMDKIEFDDYVISKRLVLEVSILGNYFTLYGLELPFSKKEESKILFDSSIIVSPFGEYKEKFLSVKQLIENEFPTFKFVPYRVLKIELEGLEEGDKKINIYQALFNLQNILEHRINGDKGFSGV